VRQKLITSAIL